MITIPAGEKADFRIHYNKNTAVLINVESAKFAFKILKEEFDFSFFIR